MTIKLHKEKTDERLEAFSKWLKQLEKLFVKNGYGKGYASSQPECWIDYFNDGYSPEGTMMEDASYG
jgi:hypothetical protein